MKVIYDTIDHKVKDFIFNQDSLNADNKTFKNSIYVVTFLQHVQQSALL